eukprot:SAG11_NODE_1442_length_4901_cov_2.114952_3_plen_173_part_00
MEQQEQVLKQRGERERLPMLEALVYGAADWESRRQDWARRRSTLAQLSAKLVHACSDVLLHGAGGGGADIATLACETAQTLLALLLELRTDDASDSPTDLLHELYKSSHCLLARGEFQGCHQGNAVNCVTLGEAAHRSSSPLSSQMHRQRHRSSSSLRCGGHGISLYSQTAC